MRKLFALIIVLMLLPLPLAGADEVSQASRDAAAEWAAASVRYERLPEHIDIVPYDQLPPVVDGQHHYLLLCIDQWTRDARPDDAGIPTYSNGSRKDLYGNTDGIVLLTLDTRAHRIMLTSFIRDAIVQKPNSTEDGERFGRINRVYNDYGPEELCRIISTHIGVRVEKYILFTFKQIANIVDFMGGVEIDLTNAEVNALQYTVLEGTVTDTYGHDILDRNHAPYGTYIFRTTEKAEKMNATSKSKILKRTGGCSAVLYMRIRKFGGGGDFMRTARARKVLSLLAEKCRAMSWEDAQALANSILENNNKTNMTLDDMLSAAELAFQLRNCTIEELRIPVEDASRPINHANMAAQEINWPYCREWMDYFLQNSWLVIDDDDDF